jgi:hypothetical protein
MIGTVVLGISHRSYRQFPIENTTIARRWADVKRPESDRTMDICPTVFRHATFSLALSLLLSAGMAFAGSATWLTFPASGDWNASGNWTPATVPNGAADTATFNSSNTTAVSPSTNTEVNGIVFSFSASFTPYTITTGPAVALTLSGVGITNNSGVTQTFETRVSGAFTGLTRFSNSASAGTLTHANFGATTGGSGATAGLPSSADASSVPEPVSALLLLLGFVISVSVHGRSSRCNDGPESSTTKEHLPCVA